MAGPFRPFLEQAEQRDVVFTRHRQRLGMPVRHRAGNHLEIHAADRRLDVGKIAVQHGIAGVEKIRLEEFAADIAFGGAEADLAHGLHQRLFRRLSETLEGLVGVSAELFFGAELHAERIDSRSAETEHGGDMVRRGDLPAFDHQREPQPQAFLDELLVDGGHHEDHRQGGAVPCQMPVGDDGDADFVSGKAGDGVAEIADRRFQRLFVRSRIRQIRRIQHLEAPHRRFGLLADAQHVEMGEDRRRNDDLAGGFGADVRLGAERHAQRHAVCLADRIERRIGDLGETLREIFRHAALLVGQRVDGVAVTHGRNLFGARRQHRVHQELETFLVERIGDVALMALEVAVVTQGRPLCFGWNLRQFRQPHARLVQQVAVRAPGGQHVQRFVGGKGALGDVVVAQHAAGFDAAAAHHGFRRKADLAGFRHDAEIVLCFHRAQRPEAQPVEPGADDIAVAENQRCRSVVLFFVERKIFEHRHDIVRQGVVVLPGRRHHRNHGGDEIEPVFQHAHLQRLVEAAAIRLALRADDRGILRQGDRRFRKAVLAVGVEFAVVGHQPEGLRHGRVRVGVGGKPRVKIQGVHRMGRIDQIAEIRHHLVGIQPALEHLHAGAERQRIEPGEARLRIGLRLDGEQRLVDAEIEFGLRRAGLVAAEHPLADRQLVTHRRRPDGAFVDGNVTLQEQGEPLLGECGLDQPFRFAVTGGGVGQEKVADAEAARLKIGDPRQCAEERQGQIHRNAGAIPDTFGRHAATMRHGAQRLVALPQHVMRLDAVFSRDETDAAAALLLRAVVKAGGFFKLRQVASSCVTMCQCC